jgi:hypothetical protein
VDARILDWLKLDEEKDKISKVNAETIAMEKGIIIRGNMYVVEYRSESLALYL